MTAIQSSTGDLRTTLGPGPATPRELQAVIRAERQGHPFLTYRDPQRDLLIVRFGAERRRLTIGRAKTADVSIGWDERVSALHALIERLAGELVLLDDGLSRNGTYVNGERVRGMRRLRDRDIVRVATTPVLVRNPAAASRNVTESAPHMLSARALSSQQRNVLAALCRPAMDGDLLATPPTNQEIANELYLSVAAVKVHLRALFDKFQLADLPQNKKRLALVRLALHTGAIVAA
jgi:pSer/pThr/pTyr-binding forkhead associated (FHA) protein